jgi:hypothetical protein
LTCENTAFSTTTVEGVQYFLDGAWYGDEYKLEIESQTSMDTDMYTAFFDTTNSASFGGQVIAALAEIFTFYTCPSSKLNSNPEQVVVQNCSAEFLANGQWGSSMISNNPVHTSSTYMPKSLSLNDWNLRGIDTNSEYYFYS